MCEMTQGPRKGEDDRHKLKVALEDLYNGKTCRLAVTRNKVSFFQLQLELGRYICNSEAYSYI